MEFATVIAAQWAVGMVGTLLQALKTKIYAIKAHGMAANVYKAVHVSFAAHLVSAWHRS